MKIFLVLHFFLANFSLTQINLSDLDSYRLFSDSSAESIIENGTKFCNDFFSKNNEDSTIKPSFENFFMCKFSKKRNRFYIYMLSQSRDKELSIKEDCIKIIRKWPLISDHMDKRFLLQNKNYLNGFFVDNIFNEKIIEFTNNYDSDKTIINNEINRLILQKKDSFTDNNQANNLYLQNEINKINRVYKKIISNSETQLDKLIDSELKKIVRYKVFINDIENFKSYSCNWKPGKGLIPYVKKEKFIEFENI